MEKYCQIWTFARTCTTSAKAEMTFPSVVRDLLMFAPSCKKKRVRAKPPLFLMEANINTTQSLHHIRREPYEQTITTTVSIRLLAKRQRKKKVKSHLQPGPFGPCRISPLTPCQIHQADFADLWQKMMFELTTNEAKVKTVYTKHHHNVTAILSWCWKSQNSSS